MRKRIRPCQETRCPDYYACYCMTKNDELNKCEKRISEYLDIEETEKEEMVK